MTRCPTCGHPVKSIFDHVAITCRIDMTPEQIAKLLAWEDAGFPQPTPQPGQRPCGECHIYPGETCDVCGAIQPEDTEQ